MTYTVITKLGKIQTFYLKEVADIYAQINGGVVVTPQILVDSSSQTAV